MDADETVTPVFLSAIGRSGTFIIEPAPAPEPEIVKDNNDFEGLTHDHQKATPLAEIKLKKSVEALLENDKKESAGNTTETGDSKVTPEVSPKTDAENSEILSPYVASENIKQGETTKNFVKILEVYDKTRNTESEFPGVSTENSKQESTDVICESRLTLEIQSRKTGASDVSVQRSKTETPHVSADCTKRNSPDDITSKIVPSPDVHVNAQSLSSVVSSRNFKTELPDDSTAQLKKEPVVDGPSKPGQTSAPGTAARSKNTELPGDDRMPVKFGTNGIIGLDPPTSNDKSASTDGLTIKSLVDSSAVAPKYNKDDDSNESRPGKTRTSSPRHSSPPSERSKPGRCDVIAKASAPRLSDSSTERPKPTKGKEVSTSWTSSGSSNLSAEKLRPTPAPRNSVVKQPVEPPDKYVLMHKELLDRWKFMARTPKFQSFDEKSRAILQEQADRRLRTHCLPSYVKDYKTLKEKVEMAMKNFYDQKFYEYDDNTKDEMDSVNGLPTLQFLQWILPALDEKSQDLLFECDIMRSRIK